MSKEDNLSILTRAGDWKLAGLEYVCASDAQPPAKILPCLEKYNHDGDVDDYEDDHDEEDTDYLPGKGSGPLSSLTHFMRVQKYQIVNLSGTTPLREKMRPKQGFPQPGQQISGGLVALYGR